MTHLLPVWTGAAHLLLAVAEHRLLEGLGDREADLLARRNLDRLTGLRVASHACLHLTQPEDSETRDLDGFALLHGLDHGLDHRREHLVDLLPARPATPAGRALPGASADDVPPHTGSVASGGAECGGGVVQRRGGCSRRRRSCSAASRERAGAPARPLIFLKNHGVPWHSNCTPVKPPEGKLCRTSAHRAMGSVTASSASSPRTRRWTGGSRRPAGWVASSTSTSRFGASSSASPSRSSIP